MKIIKIEQIEKKYGKIFNPVIAVNNLSFSVDEGEFVGIMGPSGAGKSTLLNIISSTMKSDSGRVTILNKEISSMKEREAAKFRKENLGFIFQDFNLLEGLTVKENIIMPLIFTKNKKNEIKRKFDHVSKILNLNELENRKVENLSGGQKQLVASARAIINNPKLLFADEPTGSLDSKSATQLLNYLEKINLNEKTTILMATHDAFTASYCSRVIFIKDGQLFSEIYGYGDRKQFFEKIINMQKTIGGGDFFNAR